MRWVGSVMAVLLLLLAVPFIYFTLNPPFSLPETGYLESDLTRDVDLAADGTTAVRIQVQHDERIFGFGRDTFPPTRMHADAAVLDGSPAQVDIRLYATDGTIVHGLPSGTDGASIDWLIPCRPLMPVAHPDRDCGRTYVAVITAPQLAADARVRLTLRAELEFPQHVPTPFMVGIGLDATQVHAVDGSALTLSIERSEGSMSVSAEQPVAWGGLTVTSDALPVVLDHEASAAGLLLRADATRRGDSVPTGFDAPPPVRLAILGPDGVVRADLGLRPAQPAVIAVPALVCPEAPCEESYRLVAQWADRANQSYEISWSAEIGVVGKAPGVDLVAQMSEVDLPEPLVTGEADGRFQHDLGEQGEVDFELVVDPGARAGEEFLLPTAGVLRVELLLDDGRSPLQVQLIERGGGTRGGGVPLVLQPGEPSNLVVDALAACERSCFGWRIATPGQRSADGGQAEGTVSINWRASLTLWQLDPFADPAPSVSAR